MYNIIVEVDGKAVYHDKVNSPRYDGKTLTFWDRTEADATRTFEYNFHDTDHTVEISRRA